MPALALNTPYVHLVLFCPKCSFSKTKIQNPKVIRKKNTFQLLRVHLGLCTRSLRQHSSTYSSIMYDEYRVSNLRPLLCINSFDILQGPRLCKVFFSSHHLGFDPGIVMVMSNV